MPEFYSNYSNQKLVVRSYRWFPGDKLLSVNLPEFVGSWQPLSFKIVDDLPCLYIMVDEHGEKNRRMRDWHFYLVDDPDGKGLENLKDRLGNHSLLYINTEMKRGGSYSDSIKGLVDWFYPVHCFMVKL